MKPVTPWQRWGRATVLGAVALAAIWRAFGVGLPVPLFDWFDLGVHEAGHLLAAPFSEVVMFMAGSFAQVAFPLTMAWYFGIRRRDQAAGGFCLVWAGTSAWDVSVYAADAVVQQLPLVGGGQHDWAYILGHFDALHLTGRIAGGIELAGAALCVAGLGVIATGLATALRRRSASVAVPETRPAPVLADDPWVSAARLPFRHEVAEH